MSVRGTSGWRRRTAPGHRIGHTGLVTTKERLHRLVDELADEQADRALMLLESVTSSPPAVRRRRGIPRSLGIGRSGRSDVSTRVDEVLAEGFDR